MKYKLLVLDVDGTLLNDKKEITPRTHAALLKAQQMGVHVVLASGRPTNGVQPLAEALELNHYGGFILSYNGGQIINAQTGELMFEKRIDPAMIPYLNRKAKENGFAIFTYHKDYIDVYKRQPLEPIAVKFASDLSTSSSMIPSTEVTTLSSMAIKAEKMCIRDRLTTEPLLTPTYTFPFVNLARAFNPVWKSAS